MGCCDSIVIYLINLSSFFVLIRGCVAEKNFRYCPKMYLELFISLHSFTNKATAHFHLLADIE